MTRTPPAAVTRALRQEVGFGCPVPECGNPYLEWHHFDPPFHVEEHHRPEGMIALCAEHHKKADAGAFTREQLRELKLNRVNAERVRGSFDWLRNDLLAVVGGMFHYQTQKIIHVDGIEVVRLTRDAEGYLRLNVKMLSLSPDQRAVIEDSDWLNIGKPADLESPPNGKRLRISYDTGDRLGVEFRVLDSADAAVERYGADVLRHLAYPLTAVEVEMKVAGTSLELGPRETSTPGGNTFSGALIRGGNAWGVAIETGLPWRQNRSASEVPKYRRLAPCPCGSSRRYKACHGIIR